MTDEDNVTIEGTIEIDVNKDGQADIRIPWKAKITNEKVLIVIGIVVGILLGVKYAGLWP